MPRIPPEEIERIKQDVAVKRLVEARGVELKPHGHDLIGLCPLHDDSAPSLVVSPAKNLWHCLGACQAGGSVIDWVMKAEQVSFRQAVERLRDELPHIEAEASSARRQTAARRAVVRSAGCAGAPEVESHQALAEVIATYHATLKQSPEALAYLESRGLASMELIEHFQLGFSNRTLGASFFAQRQPHGALWRQQLQQLGILRSTGHEHFAGSIVIPIVDEQGRVCEVYGRKIGSNVRQGTPEHLYLPGPHRGVFNVGGLGSSEEVILCEALIDALTFWSAGFRNVTSSYGVEGFGADHLQAFRRAGVRRVLIAYDHDEAGNRAAAGLGRKLAAEGFACFRVLFPKGMDANAYALALKPATRSLHLVVKEAQWLGEGPAPTRVVMPPVAQGSQPQRKAAALLEAAEPMPREGAQRETPPPPAPQDHAARDEGAPTEAPIANDPVSPLAAPMSPGVPRGAVEPSGERTDSALAAPAVALELDGDQIVMRFGDRRWRMRGLGKNRSNAELRVNLLVSRAQGGEGNTEPSYFVDTLDLYSARQRAAYIKQAAQELGVGEEVIKRDVGQLLLALEDVQQRRLCEPPAETKPELSAEEQEAALELLRDPQLLERTVRDYERCGLVGERTNKLVAHLAAISRKLDEPLAVVIQSSSAAGKSSLMDAVLTFVPEEDRVKYSAMTGQSLFYMGESNLSHKVLAIVEEEGAERASYPLKLLQSEQELSIAATGKDPQTGRLETQTYEVKGPVAIFLTTTAAQIDEELLNRCIVLTVDEEREQTRAIHRLQRDRQTLQGLLARKDAEAIRKLHQNAQRLLQPLLVANPYAQELTFLDDRTRTRRDHMKYLTLIRTIALVHQHQRPTRTVTHEGQELPYIEVTRQDIALANRLAAEVLGRSLDELAPQTRRLLLLLDEMVRRAAEAEGLERREVHVTRRQIREATGWSYDQLRVHLERLVAYEYLLVHRGRRGQSFVYELLYDGQGQDGRHFLMQLLDLDATTEVTAVTTETLGGQPGEFGGPLGGHRGVIGGPLGRAPTEAKRKDAGVFSDDLGTSAPSVSRGNGKSALVVAAERRTSLAS